MRVVVLMMLAGMAAAVNAQQEIKFSYQPALYWSLPY